MEKFENCIKIKMIWIRFFSDYVRKSLVFLEGKPNQTK